MEHTVICAECEKEFVTTTLKRIYCCRGCAVTHKDRKEGERQNRLRLNRGENIKFYSGIRRVEDTSRDTFDKWVAYMKLRPQYFMDMFDLPANDKMIERYYNNEIGGIYG
jgi:hypothetical protein